MAGRCCGRVRREMAAEDKRQRPAPLALRGRMGGAERVDDKEAEPRFRPEAAAPEIE